MLGLLPVPQTDLHWKLHGQDRWPGVCCGIRVAAGMLVAVRGPGRSPEYGSHIFTVWARWTWLVTCQDVSLSLGIVMVDAPGPVCDRFRT